VVPGPWSDAEIAYHGDNIASMLVNNGGFNCIAARVIVTHGAWNRRNALLDAIRDSLARAEQRAPYYPGAEDRWRRFVTAHPEAETYGQVGEGRVPWTLIPDVDPHAEDDLAFTTEAFCGVFSEVGLDAPRSVPDFVTRAVDFCNENLWGTLSASIIVHPASMKDPAVAVAVEKAIDDLRYGSVVVNHWSALPYGTVSMPWGAYPGHTNQDIQSGRGVVHNTYLLEDVEKAVLRGPFRIPGFKPMVFHTNRRMAQIGRLFTEFEATHDPKLLPRLLLESARA
jgi:hypothetical protein